MVARAARAVAVGKVLAGVVLKREILDCNPIITLKLHVFINGGQRTQGNDFTPMVLPTTVEDQVTYVEVPVGSEETGSDTTNGLGVHVRVSPRPS